MCMRCDSATKKWELRRDGATTWMEWANDGEGTQRWDIDISMSMGLWIGTGWEWRDSEKWNGVERRGEGTLGRSWEGR